MDKFLRNTEDLLKKLFIDHKGFIDYLQDYGYLHYNFEPSEEEFKEKLNIFEVYSTERFKKKLDCCDFYQTNEPKDLQDIPMKAIHQTTLKYLYNDSKDDLMQWYEQIGGLPWILQKQLASDASNHLGIYYFDIENLIGWIEKILPVVEVFNEKEEKVVQFRDKYPRFLDMYFFLLMNFLLIDQYVFERYQDHIWDIQTELPIHHFIRPENLMECINEFKEEPFNFTDMNQTLYHLYHNRSRE